jgi:hypothetical protein
MTISAIRDIHVMYFSISALLFYVGVSFLVSITPLAGREEQRVQANQKEHGLVPK